MASSFPPPPPTPPPVPPPLLAAGPKRKGGVQGLGAQCPCPEGRCVLREGSRRERGASRPERGGGNRRRAGRGEGSWSVEPGLVHGSELTLGRQRVGAGRPRPNRQRPWRTRSFGAKLSARLPREGGDAPWACV